MENTYILSYLRQWRDGAGARRNYYRQLSAGPREDQCPGGWGAGALYHYRSGNIRRTKESEVMVNGLDFYPDHSLSWTGTNRPKGQNLDGADLSTLLSHRSRPMETLVKNPTGRATHLPWCGTFHTGWPSSPPSGYRRVETDSKTGCQAGRKYRALSSCTNQLSQESEAIGQILRRQRTWRIQDARKSERR